MTLFNLNYLVKALSPYTVTWGLGFQYMNFLGTTI